MMDNTLNLLKCLQSVNVFSDHKGNNRDSEVTTSNFPTELVFSTAGTTNSGSNRDIEYLKRVI